MTGNNRQQQGTSTSRCQPAASFYDPLASISLKPLHQTLASAGQTATGLLAQVQNAGRGPGTVGCMATCMSVCMAVGVAVGVGAGIAVGMAACMAACMAVRMAVRMAVAWRRAWERA